MSGNGVWFWTGDCSCSGVVINPNPVTRTIIAAAISVHRALGPGLLERAYADPFAREMELRGLSAYREVSLRGEYKGVEVPRAYKVDFVVNKSVVVELKSVVRFERVHTEQLRTYLRLLHLHEGLLVNFNGVRLVDGLKRVLL